MFPSCKTTQYVEKAGFRHYSGNQQESSSAFRHRVKPVDWSYFTIYEAYYGFEICKYVIQVHGKYGQTNLFRCAMKTIEKFFKLRNIQ